MKKKYIIDPQILVQTGNHVRFNVPKVSIFFGAVISVDSQDMMVETTTKGFPIKINNWKGAFKKKYLCLNPN